MLFILSTTVNPEVLFEMQQPYVSADDPADGRGGVSHVTSKSSEPPLTLPVAVN
jgi:hypothetical protein